MTFPSQSSRFNHSDYGEWKRLHCEELYILYRSPNIVRVNESRRLRWAKHVARMEEGMNAFKMLQVNLLEGGI